MVGAGMIFDETYRPFFEAARKHGLFDRRFGPLKVELAAIASRTGSRAEAYWAAAGIRAGASSAVIPARFRFRSGRCGRCRCG